MTASYGLSKKTLSQGKTFEREGMSEPEDMGRLDITDILGMGGSED